MFTAVPCIPTPEASQSASYKPRLIRRIRRWSLTCNCDWMILNGAMRQSVDISLLLAVSPLSYFRHDVFLIMPFLFLVVMMGADRPSQQKKTPVGVWILQNNDWKSIFFAFLAGNPYFCRTDGNIFFFGGFHQFADWLYDWMYVFWNQRF